MRLNEVNGLTYHKDEVASCIGDYDVLPDMSTRGRQKKLATGVSE